MSATRTKRATTTTTKATRQPTAVEDAARKAAEQARWDRMQQAKAWADAHYLSNPGFKDAAKLCDLSPYHFHRQFREVIGVTFKAYVDGLRIAEAKRRMLAGAELPYVATSVGWANQSHFCSVFKKATGQNPTAWRRAELGRLAAETVPAAVAAAVAA